MKSPSGTDQSDDQLTVPDSATRQTDSFDQVSDSDVSQKRGACYEKYHVKYYQRTMYIPQPGDENAHHWQMAVITSVLSADEQMALFWERYATAPKKAWRKVHRALHDHKRYRDHLTMERKAPEARWSILSAQNIQRDQAAQARPYIKYLCRHDDDLVAFTANVDLIRGRTTAEKSALRKPLDALN
jgi:hypothetical protein